VIAAADPVAPLAVARAGGFGLGVRALPVPSDEDGWRPAGAVAEDLGVLLPRAIAAAGPRAVGATWLLEKHAWFVAGAQLAALLVHGAMPPARALWVRCGASGWPEAVALPTAGWAPADGARIAAALEAHLVPLVEALAAHRARRPLWRSAGDRLGQAALWCGEAFGARGRAWALASDALAAPTALRAPAGFALRGGEPFRRRTGCCLSRRCPDGATCPDCPLALR
jgi:hypothetical protein